MGVSVQNLELVVDHATPNRDAAVRLHMDLPLDLREADAVRRMLETDAWDQLHACLVARYPQHAQVLGPWLDACRRRATSAGQRHLSAAA